MSGIRPCPVCGSNDAGVRLEIQPPYRVAQCRSCGLQFTDPLPSPQELAALYRGIYYGESGSSFFSVQTLRTMHQGLVVRQRKKGLPPVIAGPVLDVGCGDGGFGALLRSSGSDVYCTDASWDSLRRSRQRGLPVVCSALGGETFPEATFSLVSLWHVLEHVPDPLLQLREIHRIIRDDGLLVVEVPNVESVVARICRGDWVGFDIPRHLQHFSRASLLDTLSRAGFKPVAWTNFHMADPLLDTLSFSYRLKLLRHRSEARHVVADYGHLSGVSRLVFFVVAALLFGLAIPFSIAASLVRDGGESMTVLARKADGGALRPSTTRWGTLLGAFNWLGSIVR